MTAWSLDAKPLVISSDEVAYVRRYIAERSRQNGECIEWTGQIGGQGRPMANLPRHGAKRRSLYAYRVVWAIERAPLPAGIHICHRCDNPICINIEHLFLGTPALNTRDKISKGRSHIYCYSPEEKIRAITEWQSGQWPSIRSLAAHLGITHGTLIRWLNGPLPAHPEVVAIRDELRRTAKKVPAHVCEAAT